MTGKECTFVKYSGVSLKLGAFICVKYALHKGDEYGNIKFYQGILTDTDAKYWEHLDLKKTELYIAMTPMLIPIGCVLLLKHKERYHFGCLVSIFVENKYRRKGIGTAMMTHVRQVSRRKKLYSYTSGAEGTAFYRSIGVKAL